MDTHAATALQEMQSCLERIGQLTAELKTLGQGVPAVEKNSRIILSALYNLQFGISDVADIWADQGGRL